MALPRYIEIDGRRYLWRDLVALRRAQATPAEPQPALFPLREDPGEVAAVRSAAALPLHWFLSKRRLDFQGPLSNEFSELETR